MTLKNNRIAIIADWLIVFWWAELVISHLLEAFPEADIYTSVCHMDHPMLKWRNVYTSWLQKIPFLSRHHKLAGILRPFAFRSFDLSGYDVIICSSSAESKQVAMGKWNALPYPSPKGEGVLVPSPFSEGEGVRGWGQVIVYCHTPTRYYWSHAKEYEDMMEFGIFNPFAKLVFRLVKWWMQRLDYEAAQKVDYFIANSENTKERIKKYYNRESEVIYPGVEVPRNWWKTVNGETEWEQDSGIKPEWQELRNMDCFVPRNDRTREPFYLGVGRCIPYKRFDLLVDAFNANGKRLILCTSTDTSLFRELKAKSQPNIEWKFRVNNEEKESLMANARAFLFPPEEDFGLVPVEAMAFGTPVIAYGKWWALETVIEWETWVFFDTQTPESVNEAIVKFEKMKWDKNIIKQHAEKFSKEVFQKNIIDFLTSKVQ